MAKEVTTTAVQSGEIVHPWMKGYTLDKPDAAAIAKQVDKYSDGDKIAAACHKVMADATPSVQVLQNARAIVQALAIKHIAVTGTLELADEVSNWLGLDNRGNRFKQFLLDNGPVNWDDKANEGRGGMVIDKTKQRAAQKEIAKGDGSFVKELVEKLNAGRGEGEFRPLNLKNDWQKLAKRYAVAIPKAKERDEARKEKGGKVKDDFTGHEVFFEAARKAGLAVT
jgi:hypothetical protein